MDNFREFIKETSAVVGITRMDLSSEPNLQIYHEYMNAHGVKLPIYSVDARSKDSVVMLIHALVAMLEYG
ncbi:MAG: hypothetical protein R3E08_10445 [Thiotrichaceae bacterium]